MGGFQRVFVICGLAMACLCLSEGRAEAMRCGGRLASRGDSALEVRAICGEPDQVVRTSRFVSLRGRSGTHDASWVEAGEMVQIQVEVWTYNLGPHRFMRELVFQNGVLFRERSLGYGF